MKRSICLFLGIALFLTGCNLPEARSTPQPPTVTPTTSLELVEDQDLQPTITNTPVPSPTFTEESQPSATPPALPEAPTSTPRTLSPIQPLASGALVTITQIRMFDLLTGWGIGYQENSGAHILYTVDGGRTWEDRTPPDTTAEKTVETGSAWTRFLDPQNAWVIYASQRMPPALQEKIIWRTQDAGLTWQASAPLQADGMEDAFIPRGFASVGDKHGWLLVNVGGGMSHDYSYLYATHDGGTTWERVTDPYSGGIQSLRNTGITFADPQYGWVSKDNLGIMPGAFFEQTTDGGNTWEQVFLPAPSELDWFSESSLCETSQPTFTDEQTGMLIVKCRLPEDLQKDIDWSLTYIYRTENRGQSWEHTRLPSPVDGLAFLDKDNGWAFGRDHYRTTDGGATWELVKTVNWDGDFSYIDTTYGWAVARNEGEIALVMTENGGQTWQIIEAGVR